MSSKTPVELSTQYLPTGLKGWLVTFEAKGDKDVKHLAAKEAMALIERHCKFPSCTREWPHLEEVEVPEATGCTFVALKNDPLGEIDPAGVARKLLHDLLADVRAGEEAWEEAHHVQRILPVEMTCPEGDLMDVGLGHEHGFLARHFPAAELAGQKPFNPFFFVAFEEHSPGVHLHHDQVVKALGDLVPPHYIVSMEEPRARTVLCVVAGSNALLSVVKEWTGLAHYSLRAVVARAAGIRAAEAEKEAQAQKHGGDAQDRPTRAVPAEREA